MTVLLEARSAVVRYGLDRRAAVAGVDLEVRAGDAIGVVGESGSGKSTLARLLTGLIRPQSGHVLVRGRDWKDVRRRDPERRAVQMVFQDPYDALNPSMTAVDAVAEVFRHWDRVSRREAMRRAAELLGETGLSSEAIMRKPSELSGGQCQRVGIARALAAGPEVLIADEPTSALDVSVQAQILNTLLSLREKYGLALVLISHDLAVVRHMTKEGLVMYGGRVVERGPIGPMLTEPSHPYTRVLVDSIPGNRVTLSPTTNEVAASHPCRFAPRCPQLQPDCAELVQLAKLPPNQPYVECVHPLEIGQRPDVLASTTT